MTHIISIQELNNRWKRCQKSLHQLEPDAEGLFVFSRLNIYYFTGSFANGLFFLPAQGEPVLFCRRGIDRARMESPIKNIVPFKSYRDIKNILGDLGCILPKCIASEMNGLTWALSNNLKKNLSGCQFIPGDSAIAMTRAKKSDLELSILRQTGTMHAKCLTKLLPPHLLEGMSELEISHKLLDLYFSEGHQGVTRMENFGEELFLGHISIGENANYSSAFNGPVGLKGMHPAAPFLGSGTRKWGRNELLTVDTGFTFEGYLTDKTQVFWLGKEIDIPEKIKDAHQFCIDLQVQITEMLKPGILPGEIWGHCIAQVEKSKWLDGFMGLGKNKVHFVGHGIGLAMDEYPVLAKGFELSLEEGMVLAVEPKIGIPGVGMVGVENSFVVTNTGGRCLTGEDFNIIAV